MVRWATGKYARMDNVEGFQECDDVRTSWYSCTASTFCDVNGMRGREQEEKKKKKQIREQFTICESRVKFETRKCHCSGETNLQTD
jgi:hypothetical protein